MLGAIFGDIAGSIYEFDNIKTTEFDLLGEGTSFTDDSILTVAVADWLLEGVLTKESLVATVKAYVHRYPNPMGSYGNRFSNWAFGSDSQPYNSWGNGSAMRVSAVGWAFDSLGMTEEVAKLSAEITHNHPEGVKGAQATAAAMFMARNGWGKDRIKAYVESKYGYDLSRTCDDIRPGYEFDESCRGTVPEAIIAFMDSVDFESAIRLAVSLGGDSDTLACITGGIAEAFYGLQQWEAVVARRLPEDLNQIVSRFYEAYVCKKC